MDPRDYIIPDYLTVDCKRMTALSQLSSQLTISEPIAGLRSTLSMGSLAHSLLTPSSVTVDLKPLTMQYATSAIDSLSLLRSATDGLKVSTALTAFSATVNALSVSSQLSESLGKASLSAMKALEPPKLPSLLSDASFRIGVGDTLDRISFATNPYFASANALYSLESQYAVAGSLAPTTINIRELLPVVSPPFLTSLHDNVLALSSATTRILDSFRLDADYLSRIPMDLIRMPGIELYAATQLTASVSLLAPSAIVQRDEDIEEAIVTVIDEFEDRLSGLAGGLVTMYLGGSEAIEWGGADWQRHALTSFRELLTHVLQKLAPDNEVLATATPDDLHNGRPTRKARLRFIFRAQSGPEIARFFEADLKAALELFDLLNSSTHRLDSNATPDQAHYLRGRIAGLVSSMLAAQGY